MAENKRGNVVEKGEGARSDAYRWEYDSYAEGKVVVDAWDLAGNVAKLEM